MSASLLALLIFSRANWPSSITDLCSFSTVVMLRRSFTVTVRLLMLSSLSTRLTRSNVSIVLVSTVPPPASRSLRALLWLRIIGTSPRAAGGISGEFWAPALIWM